MNNYNKFLKYEKDFQCYKIPYWQCIRSYIYECMCEVIRTSSSPSRTELIIQIINSIISKKITSKVEIPIYFGVPRMINSAYYDEGKESMQYLDKFIYFNQSKTNNRIKREYCTPSTLIAVLSKIISLFYSTLNREVLDIFIEFKVSKRRVNEIILYNKLFYFYFVLLFQRLKPNYIYYTRSDNFYALLKACSKLNIKSIEFQHGDIVKEEVSISHQKENLSFVYSPDILLAYSKIWTKALNIGSNTKTIVIGKKIQPLKNDITQILILIDTHYNEDQIEFIIRLKELTQIPIILKIHPNQNYKPISKFLRDKFNDDLINVIHNENSLEELFTSNTRLIGSYSTSIYFALNHGIEVYYINKDYREVNKAECFENFFSFETYDDLIVHFKSTKLSNKKMKTKVEFRYYENYDPKILKSIYEYL